MYVAEALLGEAAEAMLAATTRAGWRISVSPYVLDEIERMLVERLGFRRRLAASTRKRVMRRAAFVDPGPSGHAVPSDPKDSPVLRAALAAGADYLVTNDHHLLALNPYEGLRIISMTDYVELLRHEGLLN